MCHGVTHLPVTDRDTFFTVTVGCHGAVLIDPKYGHDSIASLLAPIRPIFCQWTHVEPSGPNWFQLDPFCANGVWTHIELSIRSPK